MRVPPDVLHDYDVVEDTLTLGPGHEIRLARVADPNELIDAFGPDDFGDDERLPYWATLWPASIELARYVASARIEGPIIELGAGLGLVSVSAARSGHAVLATDYEPEAIAFAAHNATLNGVEIDTLQWDWRGPLPRATRFATVVAADILYEARNIEPVASAVASVIAPDGAAIIADPGRPQLSAFRDALVAREFEVAVTTRDDIVIITARPHRSR